MAIATKVEGPYEVHDYTVSTSVAIPLGTLCKVADARLASAATGAAEAFAGIAPTEFVADKGKVEFGLATTGTWIMTAVVLAGGEGAIVAGSPVVMSGANLIRKAASGDLLTGAVIGRAKEDIAQNTTGEVTLSGFGG